VFVGTGQKNIIATRDRKSACGAVSVMMTLLPRATAPLTLPPLVLAFVQPLMSCMNGTAGDPSFGLAARLMANT
jgi:hypothetical protein